MRILITGSSGQLGQSFMSISKMFPSYDFLFLNKKSLDISDFGFVKSKIEHLKPDVLINCAAYTDVTNAENDKTVAELLNYKAVKNIAHLCKEFNIFLIHFSTDYVYDNKKECVTKGVTNIPYEECEIASPLHTYALSKFLGEKAIFKTSLDKFLIIRTSWLYSKYDNNFVLQVLKNLKHGISFNVVDDQIGSPTYSYDLAMSVLNSLRHVNESNSGLYHYSSVNFCSRFELALQIRSIINSNVEILPSKSNDDSIRPFFSALNPNKFCTTFKQEKFLWQDRLLYFLKNFNTHYA